MRKKNIGYERPETVRARRKSVLVIVCALILGLLLGLMLRGVI